jgi:hypothetical protein
LFTADAAVFVEVAKRRTLRDIKLAADAMPYSDLLIRAMTDIFLIFAGPEVRVHTLLGAQSPCAPKCSVTRKDAFPH